MLANNLFCCLDVNCDNPLHKQMIDLSYEKIKIMLLKSTQNYKFAVKKEYKIVPGWNDYVKPFYDAARKGFIRWLENDRPANGVLIDEMKASRSRFKNALKKCREDEESVKKINLPKI